VHEHAAENGGSCNEGCDVEPIRNEAVLPPEIGVPHLGERRLPKKEEDVGGDDELIDERERPGRQPIAERQHMDVNLNRPSALRHEFLVFGGRASAAPHFSRIVEGGDSFPCPSHAVDPPFGLDRPARDTFGD
jgi:hypothetical protein